MNVAILLSFIAFLLLHCLRHLLHFIHWTSYKILIILNYQLYKPVHLFFICIVGLGSRFIRINFVTLYDGGRNMSNVRRKILIYMHKMKYDLCGYPSHRFGTLFTKNECHIFVKSGSQDWICPKGVESIFLFNHFTNHDVFHGCLIELIYACYLLDP